MTEKKIIGRVEKIDFPDWNISGIDAKIDTGAYTASLHCHDIKMDDEKLTVSFYVLDPTHPEFENQKVSCPVHDFRSIKSSNGSIEDRIIIKTNINIHGMTYPVELSLTDRSEMRFPVLLGRRFIKNKFIVDVSRKYVGNSN
jgi:hypothetical protein